MYRTRTAVSLIAALIAISAFIGPASAAGTLDQDSSKRKGDARLPRRGPALFLSR